MTPRLSGEELAEKRKEKREKEEKRMEEEEKLAKAEKLKTRVR